MENTLSQSVNVVLLGIQNAERFKGLGGAIDGAGLWA